MERFGADVVEINSLRNHPFTLNKPSLNDKSREEHTGTAEKSSVLYSAVSYNNCRVTSAIQEVPQYVRFAATRRILGY